MSDAERVESRTFSRAVIDEDIALCESVQRGLERQLSEQRLVIGDGGEGPDESCIAHFHAPPAGEARLGAAGRRKRDLFMNEGRAGVEMLLRHGVVVTMDEQRRIFTDGAVAVSEGRVVAVGRDPDLARDFEAEGVRDLQGALVHPGLVDAHLHTGLDLLRGLVPESSADWTEVEAPFIRDKTGEDEYLSTMLCCMEMVSNGSTLYSDTGSSDDLDAAARATELVGVRGMPGHFVADRAGEIDTWHQTGGGMSRNASGAK